MEFRLAQLPNLARSPNSLAPKIVVPQTPFYLRPNGAVIVSPVLQNVVLNGIGKSLVSFHCRNFGPLTLP